jgi:orotidine-5'-phosphate decarboxylase
MEARDRLIVALDYADTAEARELTIKLDGVVSFYKVGWDLFLSGGVPFVQELFSHGNRVFLDLKMDDIPETVKRAVHQLHHCGAHFFTLQGDHETFEAAKAGRNGAPFPRNFLYVPVLSSRLVDGFDLEARQELELMVQGGIEGVVASGKMVGLIREYFNLARKDLIIVAPGIRQSGQSYNDHRRSLTPSAAVRAGADYLVMGRPIRDAKDPRKVAEAVIEEMRTALER